MILPKYLEEEVVKYCKASSIPIRDGEIPAKYKKDVHAFIHARMRKDRFVTRKLEEQNKYKMSTIMRNLLDDVEKSPIEVFLREALIREGLYKFFKEQFPIGTKTVDFACEEAHLVVECDGKAYHHTEIEQIERDQKRDKYLARKGWRVLHIEGLAIRRNINLCMEKIREALNLPTLPKLEITSLVKGLADKKGI